MQKGIIYLGISFLSAFLSLITLIRLFDAPYSASFWNPFAGSFVGLVFGVLAKADTVGSEQGCIVNTIIFITFILLVTSVISACGLAFLLAQLQA